MLYKALALHTLEKHVSIIEVCISYTIFFANTHAHGIWHKLYTDSIWVMNLAPKNMVIYGPFFDRTS